MSQPNLSGARVLIAGAKGYAGSILRSVLNACGILRVDIVEDPRRALDLLCLEAFDAVFIEDELAVDDVPFAIAARRNPALRNPLIPIFAVYSGARRRDIEKSRDLGINDVIARPISPKTVSEKLWAAMRSPRPFIAGASFFGPDRRSKLRAGAPHFAGERRILVPKKTKIQPLDI